MGLGRFDNPFKKLESRFDLHLQGDPDDDAPGVHSRRSFHYRLAPWRNRKDPDAKEARDYGDAVNHRRDLVRAGVYLASMAKQGKRYRGRRIREVFGPFPFYVKDGKVYRGRFPDHDDHLHVAFSD